MQTSLEKVRDTQVLLFGKSIRSGSGRPSGQAVDLRGIGTQMAVEAKAD